MDNELDTKLKDKYRPLYMALKGVSGAFSPDNELEAKYFVSSIAIYCTEMIALSGCDPDSFCEAIQQAYPQVKNAMDEMEESLAK